MSQAGKVGSKATFGAALIERPLVSVDVAIFSVIDAELNVLLMRRQPGPHEPYPGLLALPGGFIDVAKDRDLIGCALRKLKEKTAVAAPYLEQVGSWGDAKRDPRGWSTTHVYFALINAEVVALKQGGNAADVQWLPVSAITPQLRLAFDHAMLFAAALARLRSKVEYTSLPAYLLPREFTLSDLQSIYEVVLQRPLEKSAFRTRVLATDLLEEVPRIRTGPNRPAQLYRLRNPEQLVFFPRTFNPPRD